MQLFDAHCHLQDKRLFGRFEEVIERADWAGVKKMALKGTCQSDWTRVERLGEACEGIEPSFGLHPWFIANRTETWESDLRQFLIRNHSAGVGEIGIDHALSNYDAEDQARVLRAQLAIAREMKRPATIHCRRAWGALAEILKEFGSFPDGILIHCYGGSPEMIRELLKYNAWFSFSGTITRPNNKMAARSLPATPSERIMIETDTPDLYPYIRKDKPRKTRPLRNEDEKSAEFGKKLNEPACLPFVLEKASELRRESCSELAKLCFENAERFFRTFV